MWRGRKAVQSVMDALFGSSVWKVIPYVDIHVFLGVALKTLCGRAEMANESVLAPRMGSQGSDGLCEACCNVGIYC
eukprot:472095-Amorphochlora_amoeboformis.AAC.1